MNDFDRAINCYEAAIRHNTYSIPALTKIGILSKNRNQFARVIFANLPSLFPSVNQGKI